MKLRIEQSQESTEEERLAILAPLHAYNVAQAGIAVSQPLTLLVRDEEDVIQGGLYGRFACEWLFIDLLSVPEQGRGRGIGSRLMRMAEDRARDRGCVGLWLDTFDFQAPEFYRKLGFSQFGELQDYPPGHKRMFFQKRLSD